MLGLNVVFFFNTNAAIVGNLTAAKTTVYDNEADVITASNLNVTTAYAIYIGTKDCGNFTSANPAVSVSLTCTIIGTSSVTAYLYSGATTVTTITITILVDTGTITISSSNVFDQATDVITLSDLSPNTPYNVYIGTTSISGNFTTGNDPQPIPFYPTISMPATGSTVTVYLYSGAVIVDKENIGVTGVQSIIPFNLLVNIGIMLFILFIIAAILREFIKRRNNNVNED